MGKYFLTGPQGSGKSTTLRGLREAGVAAYDIEAEPGIMQLQHLRTGKFIDWPSDGVIDWGNYGWNIQTGPLEKLLTSAPDVVVGAVASNHRDFYPLFDRVFFLMVNEEILRRQLPQSEHECQHDPARIEKLVANYEAEQEAFLRDGAVPILGGRALSLIVQDIRRQMV